MLNVWMCNMAKTRNVYCEYNTSIPARLDIFCNLPDYVFDVIDAQAFLNDLKRAILQWYQESKLDDITLSKLLVDEHSDTGIVIDWIFSYFQVYFSFDKNDGDYYGIIMADHENGEFSNTVIKIRPEKRMTQIQNILNTVVLLLR